MYEVINDRVERCDELPAPEGGAPNPICLGLEGTIILAYRMCKQDPRWEERWTTLWTDSDEKVIEECIAINTTVKIHCGDIDFTDLVELLNES